MTCAKVQAVGVVGANVTSVTTSGITTTSGNLIHIDSAAYSNVAFQHDMVVTDSKSNAWNVGTAQHLNVGGETYMQSDYAKNITGGASHTFTVTVTPTGYMTVGVIEISGADLTSPLDLHESANVGPTTSPSMTTSGSTAQADEIAIGAVSNYNAGPTITEASGWTTGYAGFAAGGGMHSASKVLSATGTVTYNPAASANNFYNMQITTYKGAAAAASRVNRLAALGVG